MTWNSLHVPPLVTVANGVSGVVTWYHHSCPLSPCVCVYPILLVSVFIGIYKGHVLRHALGELSKVGLHAGVDERLVEKI